MLSTDKAEEKRGKRRQGETPVRDHTLKVANHRHKQEIEQVPVAAQSLEELLEATEGYLNWLDSIGADEAKQEFRAAEWQKLCQFKGIVYQSPL